MSKGFTSGSGQTSTGNVGKKRYVRKRADKTKQTINTASGNPGITAYDQGPVYDINAVNAINEMAPAQAAQATASPYSLDPTFGASPTGLPATGAGGGTGNQNKTNFGNEYYWASPEFAVGKAMNNLGMSTDVNSSFANAMASLAPGLKWMSLLGGGPTGGIADFQNNVGNWMGAGDQSGFGRLGDLNSMIQTLVGGGGGNALLEGYIDSMDPRQMLAAIGQMAQTAGYGQIAPELLQGLSGQMENIYNQFGINGGELLANLGPGQSDMDVFRDYFQKQGSGLLDYFGGLGF